VPAKVSEAYVLRTYPFQEADLVVSFLTRDQGKLRGVAKRARRPKSNFGSGLERLSHVRMSFDQRETRELVRLDSCELVESQFALQSSYEASLVLDYMAELAEQLLPLSEPSEKYFRLLNSMLSYLRGGGQIWAAATYYTLWAARLSGFLPALKVSRDSAEIAEEMFDTPIANLTEREWSKDTARDLRRFCVRQIEAHVERRLMTVSMLEAL